MHAYFISGLGADKNIFSKIKLPEGYTMHHLDWIKPLPKEPVGQYATRLSEKITHNKFILVGLSFGGLVANEIARIRKPEKVIIISSMATVHDLPWYFKKAGKLQLQNLLPVRLFKTATLLNHFMGTGKKEERAIVQHYVRNTEDAFIRWSLDTIVNWSITERFENLYHIHGTRDHLLPCKYTRADFKIQGGGHLMVYNKAAEVNRIIHKILAV